MTHTFTLQDSLAARDLQVFLGRAGRVEDGSARVIVANGVLAVYVAIFYPVGLLDQAPTVLGLRTFEVVDTDDFDAVVPVGSFLERIARRLDQSADDADPVTVTLPMEVHTVTWAAISPPRGGWAQVGPTTVDLLETVAKAGISEVAEAIPTGTGEQSGDARSRGSNTCRREEPSPHCPLAFSATRKWWRSTKPGPGRD
jgi:hypothetical protein